MTHQELTTITGEKQDLADYAGKALLIVNTASQCGYTKQYSDLQALWERYRDQGLVVMGFPSNDYGDQEPGTGEEIQNFCQRNYGVTFPLFAKSHAKGQEKAPLFKLLTEQSPEPFRGEIRWNFTKFLLDPKGEVVGRWDSKVKPMAPEVTRAIEQALAGARPVDGEGA